MPVRPPSGLEHQQLPLSF
uniref:Uncharacterized protein n=1 Tax=Anguilla anguilla TaxID=7936 RepID=A0A0E9TQ54_ANGAN